mgnify:CR=1 FL=1
MRATALIAEIKTVAMGCATTLTAAGSGDNTELTGEVIDRLGFESCVVAVPFKAVLATAESLALTIKVAESEDGSTFGSDETIASAVTVVTQASGGTTHDTYFLNVNLSGVGAPRKRYLKFKLTPNLSASATDTAVVAGLVILGGAVVKPQAAFAAATA